MSTLRLHCFISNLWQSFSLWLSCCSKRAQSMFWCFSYRTCFDLVVAPQVVHSVITSSWGLSGSVSVGQRYHVQFERLIFFPVSSSDAAEAEDAACFTGWIWSTKPEIMLMIFLKNVAHTAVFRKQTKKKSWKENSNKQLHLMKLKTLRHPAVVVFVPLCRRLSFSLNQSSGNWRRVGPL